ncbi:THAP domain [Popillia japonica]|uniref:THAP domain n=1 Tax=Popillia japonica TaxID=7064 RepID=A0AAW1JJJ1_POPJA
MCNVCICFPKHAPLCNRWLQACENENVNITHARICSIHFTDDSYLAGYTLRRKYGYSCNRSGYLKLDAVAREHLPLQGNLPSTSGGSSALLPAESSTDWKLEYEKLKSRNKSLLEKFGELDAEVKQLRNIVEKFFAPT